MQGEGYTDLNLSSNVAMDSGQVATYPMEDRTHNRHNVL
jgi:hypothetical protein